MFYTNYYSLFITAALLLFVIIYRNKYSIPFLWLASGLVLLAVLFIPWLMSGVVAQALQINLNSQGQPPWFAIKLSSLLSAINAFNNGKVYGLLGGSPRWTYIIGGLLLTLPAFGSWRSSDNKPYSIYRENLIYLLLLSFIPLILMIS